MAPPKQKHESLSEEPDSDGGGASDFILKAISPSKRRPSSIPGVSGAKKKMIKKKKTMKDEAAAAAEADEHIAVSADAGNVGVGVTKMKKNKSAVVQVVQKGVNKDDDETLKEKISGGEGGAGGRGGGAVALEVEEEEDAGQSSSRKRNKKMSNKSNQENNKKEKAKQKKIKAKRKDEEKMSGDEMMIPPNGAGKEKEGEDNTGNRKHSKKSMRAEPAGETEEKAKQEGRSEEEIRGNLSSAEDTNNAVNMTVEVGKEKENEEDQEWEEGKELNCKMEYFWCHHPNLKESMETGMFGPMPLAGKWLSSNSLGREKAKELEQKWMSLQKAETELFHERMVLIKEEIGGVLSTVADP